MIKWNENAKQVGIEKDNTFSGSTSLFNSFVEYEELEPTPEAPIPPKLLMYFWSAEAPITLHTIKTRIIQKHKSWLNNEAAESIIK